MTRKKGRGLRGITRSNVREYEAFEQEGAAGAPQRLFYYGKFLLPVVVR